MKRIAPIAAALLSLLFYVVVFAQDVTGTVNKGANLRSGPGTTFAIVSKATQSQTVTIAHKNDAGDWYQLDTGEWIAAFLVTLDTTPVVAGTPTATAIPTKQVTAVDILNDPVAQVYIDGVTKALDSYSIGADIISERFREAGKNTSVIFTDKWKLSVGAGLASLQMSTKAIRELDPPSYFSGIHNDLLAVADHTDNSIALLIEGIDQLDADKLIEGTAEINLAAEFITSANDKLDVFKAAAAAVTPTPMPATPTRRPTGTKIPNPTATSEIAATETTISDATNANDWANASAEQRVAIVHHFYELWQKNTGNRVKISEKEMEVCINAQVASPNTPLTMMILALAANCIS